MSAGRIRVLVKSSGSCSGGSESESESSSIRACWDMVGGEEEGRGCCGGGNDEWVEWMGSEWAFFWLGTDNLAYYQRLASVT